MGLVSWGLVSWPSSLVAGRLEFAAADDAARGRPAMLNLL